MIIGAHSIIYSKHPEADRAFLRDVLELSNIDAGDGWLIFALPPSEVSVHPSDRNDVHTFYLMCRDVNALIAKMSKRNIKCSPVQNRGWGMLTRVKLPGGGTLGVYQPRHRRPAPLVVDNPRRPKPTRTGKSSKRQEPGRPASRSGGKSLLRVDRRRHGLTPESDR